MNLRLPLFLMLCFTFSNALAAACDVYTHSQSEQVPVVEQHTCYTYEGVPADAIDWSCSNENKDMMNTKKPRSLNAPATIWPVAKQHSHRRHLRILMQPPKFLATQARCFPTTLEW